MNKPICEGSGPFVNVAMGDFKKIYTSNRCTFVYWGTYEAPYCPVGTSWVTKSDDPNSAWDHVTIMS